MDREQPPPAPPPPPRFLVDAMLGNVARDLRLLGYDAAYAGREEDGALLHRAQAEGRILVTRDRGLARRAGGLAHVLVTASSSEEQTREALRAAGAACLPCPFSRCLECNEAVVEASPDQVWAAVPDHVGRAKLRFRRCLGCGRVYWEGSHLPRLRRKIRRLTGSLHPTGGPV